ncbi:MAG: hypothetical protein R3A10_23395, partial [Caldilineaceae bacterium]
MNCPPSPHFAPLDLSAAWTGDRALLPHGLRTPAHDVEAGGVHSARGIPFAFGDPAASANVILLDDTPVVLDVADVRATYILFLHAVEDRASTYQPGFADDQIDGNELGDHVAGYALEYTDGARADTPILRRFAIQQSRIGWGASPFAAIPAEPLRILRPVNEQ